MKLPTIEMIDKLLIPREMPWLCKISSVTMTKARIARNPMLATTPRIHGNRLRCRTLSNDDLCGGDAIALTFLLKGIIH